MEKPKENEAPVQPVQILLTYDPLTDTLLMAGPMKNKVLCYGILEKAKDNVRNFKDDGKKLVMAGPGDMPPAGGRPN